MTQDEAAINLLTRALEEAEQENSRLHERMKALEDLVEEYHGLFATYKENDAVKYLKNHVQAAQRRAEELLEIKKS